MKIKMTVCLLINVLSLALVLSCSSDDTSQSTYIQQGNDLLMQGEEEKAIAIFDQAIDANPNQAETYVIRGIAYLTIDPNVSLVDFNKAIEINQEYVDAYLQRGNFYFNRAFALGDSSDLELAMNDFDTVIEIEPDNSEGFNKRARIHILAGNKNQGLFDLNDAIRHNPLNAEAVVDRGMLLGDLAQEETGVDPDLKESSCDDLSSIPDLTNDALIIQDAMDLFLLYEC